MVDYLVNDKLSKTQNVVLRYWPLHFVILLSVAEPHHVDAALGSQDDAASALFPSLL
jgi:hypothetical protein